MIAANARVPLDMGARHELPKAKEFLLYSVESNTVPFARAPADLGGGLRACFHQAHRWTIGLCLVGTLLQSMLLLPVPLLQCWVIDRLLLLAGHQPPSSAAEADVILVILLALGGTITCFLLR